MTKYIIKYNYGYGDTYEVVEAESIEEADKIAYEAWREAAENSAEYCAEEWTEELAEDHGL